MYGVEAQGTGLGGLAAQAPPDLYFGSALGIQSQASGVAGAPSDVTGTPYGFSAQGGVLTPTLFSGASVSSSGSTVQSPVSQEQPSWRSVFNFHNSVAPWILLGILVLYGWLHASARASVSAGRAKAGAEAVL